MAKERTVLPGSAMPTVRGIPTADPKEGLTLIDKVVLYNFSVTGLCNENELVRHGLLVFSEGHNGCQVNGTFFNKLEIRDGYEELPAKPPFKEFFFGLSHYDYQYCRLELLVDHNDGRHNLFGNSVDEVREQVRQCEEYLDKLGITVDFSDVKIEELELNRTSQMICGLRFSDPAFQVLGNRAFYVIPGKRRMNKNSIYKKRRSDPLTFMASSVGAKGKGLTAKLYDKTAELNDKYAAGIDVPYFRYELTIKGSDKINSIFGSNMLSELTDADMDGYFVSWIKDNIEEPSKKLARQTQAKLRKNIRDLYRSNNRRWAYRLILWIQNEEIVGTSDCSTIMGRDEIYDAIESLNVKEFKDRNRKYRMKKAISKVLDDTTLKLVIADRSFEYWDAFLQCLKTPSDYTRL